MADNRRIAKALLWAFGVWVAHLLAVIVVILVSAIAIGRVIEVLDNSDADLPAASVLAISVADYFVSYWYTLIVPVAVDAAFLVGLGLAQAKWNWLAWLWSTLWFLCAILFLGFMSLAVTLPLPGLKS